LSLKEVRSDEVANGNPVSPVTKASETVNGFMGYVLPHAHVNEECVAQGKRIVGLRFVFASQRFGQNLVHPAGFIIF
jgi:hypothetical protein